MSKKIQQRKAEFRQYHEETAIKRMLLKGPPVANGPVNVTTHIRLLHKKRPIGEHIILHAHHYNLDAMVGPNDVPLVVFIQEPHYPVIVMDSVYYPVIKMKKYKFAINTTHQVPQESIDFIDEMLARHIGVLVEAQ